MPRTSHHLLLTCEHGGFRVPRDYAWLFAGRQGLLRTHRGHDPGALTLARLLARRLHAPLLAVTVTRLLVENNRSLHHPDLFSSVSRRFDARQRRDVVERWYQPHRQAVIAAIDDGLSRGGRVVHVGVHSFTPVRRGEVRPMDVGLLYDPRRPPERDFCRRWGALLRQHRPDAVVRFNAPYRGIADGLTTALRRRYEPGQYLGIELEVNQKHVRRGGAAWTAVQRWIASTLAEALG